MKKELKFERLFNVDGERLNSLIEEKKTTINIYSKYVDNNLCCFFDVVCVNTDRSLLVVDTDTSDNFGLRLDDSKMTGNEFEHINLSIPIFDDLLCDFGFYEAFKAFLSIKSQFY